MTKDLETRLTATGGLCTWALQLASGDYVYDPDLVAACGSDLSKAYVWLDREPTTRGVRAWMGSAVTVVRSR